MRHTERKSGSLPGPSQGSGLEVRFPETGSSHRSRAGPEPRQVRKLARRWHSFAKLPPHAATTSHRVFLLGLNGDNGEDGELH
jgi:hypothetical protein